MASINIMNNLPFANVTKNIMLDNNNNHIESFPSTNYDTMAEIDPDKNNVLPNALKNQCKSYDTSFQFNKGTNKHNNIAILHTNICSSIKKLKDFMYNIDNLDTKFHFIGLSETWATIANQDLLEIVGYSHEQCIRSNNKKGGGVSLYIHNSIQYKKRDDLAFPTKLYETIFVEVDKTMFHTNRNVVIGEIYNPPSSKLKCFNTNLENFLNKIKKEKNMFFFWEILM